MVGEALVIPSTGWRAALIGDYDVETVDVVFGTCVSWEIPPRGVTRALDAHNRNNKEVPVFQLDDGTTTYAVGRSWLTENGFQKWLARTGRRIRDSAVVQTNA